MIFWLFLLVPHGNSLDNPYEPYSIPSFTTLTWEKHIYSYNDFITISNNHIDQACLDYSINRKDIHVIHMKYFGRTDPHNRIIFLNYISYDLREADLRFMIYHELGHIYIQHGFNSPEVISHLIILFLLLALTSNFNKVFWCMALVCGVYAIVNITGIILYKKKIGPYQENEANAIACDKLIGQEDYRSCISIYPPSKLMNTITYRLKPVQYFRRPHS